MLDWPKLIICIGIFFGIFMFLCAEAREYASVKHSINYCKNSLNCEDNEEFKVINKSSSKIYNVNLTCGCGDGETKSFIFTKGDAKEKKENKNLHPKEVISFEDSPVNMIAFAFIGAIIFFMIIMFAKFIVNSIESS